MIDPVNTQDKVVVVAVMAEKEVMLVYIVAHAMCLRFCGKSFTKFNTIIPARASKVETIYSSIEFQFFLSSVLLTLIFS